MAIRRRWTLHALAWVVGLTAFRVGLIPPQHCREVTRAEIDHAIELASSWASTNLLPDGSFTYRYDRAANRDLGGYNVVRHAGLVNALYQVAVADETAPVDAADAGLDWMLERLVRHDDWVAFADPPSDVRLGGTALFVASLVHRRRATGDTRHDELAHAASRFLVAQIGEGGAPAAFWSPATGRPVPDRYGPFATGEAAWALALMANDWPDRGYGEAADAIITYVVEERRDREDLILRLPDHWIAYALGERDRPLRDAEAEYAARLAGDFALMSRVEATRSEQGVQSVLRSGHALGAGVGAMGEGIGGLWRVASAGDALDGRADELAARLACVTGLLVDRQVTAADVRAQPEFELGAWFRRDITQMDDQQHAISALVAAREILTGGGLR